MDGAPYRFSIASDARKWYLSFWKTDSSHVARFAIRTQNITIFRERSTPAMLREWDGCLGFWRRLAGERVQKPSRCPIASSRAWRFLTLSLTRLFKTVKPERSPESNILVIRLLAGSKRSNKAFEYWQTCNNAVANRN